MEINKFKIHISDHLGYSVPVLKHLDCPRIFVRRWFGDAYMWDKCPDCKELIPEHIIIQMKLLDGERIWK